MGALGDAAARASVCRNVHPDAAMRDAAEQLRAGGRRAGDRALARPRRLRRARRARRRRRRRGHALLRARRRCATSAAPASTGTSATRARVKALREELVRIGQEFGRNINDDVRTLDARARRARRAARRLQRAHQPGADGKVTHHHRQHRLHPVHDLRQERHGARGALAALPPARPSGEPRRCCRACSASAPSWRRCSAIATWAAYVTEDKMIGTARARRRVHRAHRRRRRARARSATTRSCSTRKRKDDPARAATSTAWDSAFYQERVKAEQYGFDSQAVRPYFEYERVKQGVLDITGAHLRHRATSRSPTRRCGTPTSRPTTSSRASDAARPHLPRHAPARGQVQARRAVHAGQRRRAGARCPRACWSATSRGRAAASRR